MTQENDTAYLTSEDLDVSSIHSFCSVVID